MTTTELLDSKMAYSAYNNENIASLIKNNLSNAATGDEFYQKLVELKNEQKKTLEYMKELYNQKQVLKSEIEKSEQNFNELKFTVSKPLDPQTLKFERNVMSAYDNNSNKFNEINGVEIHTHKDFIIENKKFLDHDIVSTPDCKICSTETHRNTTVHSKPPLPTKFDDSYDKVTNGIDNNLKKIEQMWDKFNLADYNNNGSKYSELKVFENKGSNHSPKVTFEEDWAYRSTVPKPFNLTIREEQKAGKKSKRQLQLEEELRKKQEAELEECNKQFKATPLPLHVTKPIYEEIKQEEEYRKLRLKLESKEYLESVSKPFKLTERERRHSFSGQIEYDEDITDTFMANPLPEFYFDNEYLSERRKEEELYRKIKAQIRSHKLLKSSQLPKNMRLLKDKKRLEEERKIFSSAELKKLLKAEESSKNVRKSYDVPNYDDLYKKFATEVEAKRYAGQSKTTVCKPFSLHTNDRAKKKALSSHNSSRISSAKSSFGRESLQINDSMARLQRSLSASMDAMPIQHNQSHKLRESVSKSKINSISINETRKEHIDKIKKIKAQNMVKNMQTKLKNPSPSEVAKNIDRKTRKFKLEEQKKQEEFEKQLDLMYKKVESRKFLFEQADEENAKKAAEKKFRETLKNAGLSEDILNEDNNKNKKVAKKVSKSYTNNDTNDNWLNE